VPSLTALVGAATAAYSTVLVAAPRLLISACGLEDSPATRTLTRSVGARDVGLGLALVLTPAGTARRVVVGARALADLSDAAVFGAGATGRVRRVVVAGSAAAWGAVVVLAGVLDERAGR
jgi:hypothetical protein